MKNQFICSAFIVLLMSPLLAKAASLQNDCPPGYPLNQQKYCEKEPFLATGCSYPWDGQETQGGADGAMLESAKYLCRIRASAEPLLVSEIGHSIGHCNGFSGMNISEALFVCL